jgi:hypothetical protein
MRKQDRTKSSKLLLLKNLINSDFLIADKVKATNYTRFSLKPALGFKTVSIIDPITLVKEIKQSIRMLQFLKKSRNPLLNLFIDNRQHFDFLQFFFAKKNSFYPWVFRTNTYNRTYSNSTNILFLLGESINNQQNKISKLIFDKLFLINKINLKYEHNTSGIYKLHNDLSNFKKLTFLITILRKFYQLNTIKAKKSL